MTLLWLLRETVLSEPLSPLQIDDEMAQLTYPDSFNLSRETICAEEFLKVAYRSLDYSDCSEALPFSGSAKLIALKQAS